MKATFVHVWRSEGLRGLQAGLRMAMIREGSKSFFRIGCFRPILGLLHDPGLGPPPIYKRMIAGMSSGAMGSVVA